MSAKHTVRRSGTDIDDGLEAAQGSGNVRPDEGDVGDNALRVRTVMVRRGRALNAAVQRTCLPMMALSRALEAEGVSK